MIITGKKFSKPSLSRVINGDTILPDAPTSEPKLRLDQLLLKLHPEYNRSSLQKFIKAGFVTADGIISKKPSTLVSPDAKISLQIPPTAKQHVEPEVIYEDENVLVLNKPAGMLSMAKGEYCPETTLEDYGLIVHRLDRGTSGVVILAKNPATQTFLRKQFQERKAHKTYHAIVEGKPKLAEAMIDLPIARNLKHPTTFMVTPSGKPAQTYYRILSTQELPGKQRQISLLELKPTTGRTHQLRVHLRHLGTPILGDVVYNSQASADERLYLHASELEITIPPHAGNTSAERRTFTAPLPVEFTQFFPQKTKG